MGNNVFIRKLWHWFDDNLLLLATGFLLIFIPLYPKIPLGEIIPGYIVRVRLEDFVVFGIFVWWMIQAGRRRVAWRTPLTGTILAYLGVGLLSNLIGIGWTGSIPPEMLHIGKSMLHWLRHIEYFALFFVAYAAVREKSHAWKLLLVATLALMGVVIYGVGQKYFYFPVYSTMNREFSKGIRLYLGENARVQSTFAGHYDLGGYLAFTLPVILALYFMSSSDTVSPGAEHSKKAISKPWGHRWRWVFLATWLSGLWLLVMSASRASFIGYVVGVSLVVLLWGWRRWTWVLTRGLAVMTVSGLMLIMVGDLSSRFLQLVDQDKHPQIHRTYHTINDYFKHPQKILGLTPPNNGLSVDELERQLNAQGMTTSDTLPSQTPSDVYTNVPEQVSTDPAATLSGAIKVGDQYVLERTYSDCALQRSLSLCIRLETLWPRAVAGFLRNPLVGSGYATLTKETVAQFTEAESTDNNFLRTLGENGALGFIFYYGTIGLTLYYAWRTWWQSADSLVRAIAVGALAGTVGLLLNAMYIDVFVASKVAYSFWLLQGIMLALLVRVGVLGQKYDLSPQRTVQTTQLAALLQQVDQAKQAQINSGPGSYLSLQKRRRKSTKKRRR